MNHGHGPGGRDGRAAAAAASGTHGEAASAPAPSPASRQQSSSDNPRAPPRRVDHTYRDYSNFPPQDLPPGKADKPPRNFPSKLHAILSTPEYAHIISWMPHGRAWKIHNKDLLISDVVPKYFVQSKYESFSRQLNGWGFKRLHQSGNDYNAYYHECFLRGLPHLVSLMKRVQANQGKLLPHVEGEPNFYEIDRQFPLPATEAPMMPYPGHYPPHGPYGSMPPPDGHSSGYHGAGGYASHPGWYAPPPPYYGHGAGPPPGSAPATEAPMMPYPGHYPPHGPYGSMPPPDGHSFGYHGAGGYASHPGWYAPSPPYYGHGAGPPPGSAPATEAPMMPYPGHYPPHGPYGSMPPPDGHSSGYHGAGGYASHPGWYPPPPPGGYAPHGSPSRYDNPPPSDRAESQEGLQRPWAPIQEQKEGEDDHWDPIANEESLEPLPITESENPTTTESSEKDSNTGNGDF